MTSTQNIQIRRSEDRGHLNFGWLDTKHTFSFGSYQDPEHTGFRSLRVINEDSVEPGKGFGTHSHEDMEIITYVLKGQLKHRDSMEHSLIIEEGEIQRMSAGTGVTHSEFNSSNSRANHFLQIWITPRTLGSKPSYEQKLFSRQQKLNTFCLVASPQAEQGSLKIDQDAKLYASIIEQDQSLSYTLSENRHCWLHLATGTIDVLGKTLKAGDAISLSGPEELVITSQDKSSELLLFDLA